MTVITGGQAGSAADATIDASASVGTPVAVIPSSTESAIAAALLRCMARWGLAKTTIEDVAREAGVSRATVYRLFPGGKAAILHAAARAEVAAMVSELTDALAAVDDLEDCLTLAIQRAACFLEHHEALRFMRTHERVALEQVLAFDRLDTLFRAASELLQPALGRFLSPELAGAAGTWLARLLVSYLNTPSPELDLMVEGDARRLVRTFVLPGLHPTTHPPSAAERAAP